MANSGLDRQYSQAAPSDEEIDKPMKLVKQHKVCWEVWPEYHIDREGKKIQIGFELDLLGTHYRPEHIPEPGCEECLEVYNDLKHIAQWILPKEKRDSRYEVGVFDASIHYASQREFRRDIIVPIKILHREGYHRPLDDCEIRCLNEMKEKLKELGAHERDWPELAKETKK
jgi:hypothetical protein